jgi:hypothetical protein
MNASGRNPKSRRGLLLWQLIIIILLVAWLIWLAFYLVPRWTGGRPAPTTPPNPEQEGNPRQRVGWIQQTSLSTVNDKRGGFGSQANGAKGRMGRS